LREAAVRPLVTITTDSGEQMIRYTEAMACERQKHR